MADHVGITPTAEGAGPRSRGFLLNEYEALWRYIIHLDRERRDAVRLLFAALPGIPAAAYGLASGRHGMPLSAAAIAPWMVPLLLVLWLLSLCYFWVIVKMRIAAVGYTRKLNLTRKYLVQPYPCYEKDLSCLDKKYLDPYRPDYVGYGGTDFWYRVLVAIPVSATAGMAAYLIAAFASCRGAMVIGAGTSIVCAPLMVVFSSHYLAARDHAGN